MRRATVRSLAKLNLDLRVLDRRPDGYHELRTVFQTISLADRITIEYTPGRRTTLAIDGNVDIPGNLILKAAESVMEACRVKGAVRFRLEKRIPMGAGLGGGSSNAAAILLALPVLSGAVLPVARLISIAAALGSDVPFFLFGGAAAGIGRGTELFPLPDLGGHHGIVVSSSVHVSTAEAYRALNRKLTIPGSEPDTGGFQSVLWGLGDDRPDCGWMQSCANDFEEAVFARHPELRVIRRRLERAGARPARMTGSGSAVFGIFGRRRESLEAAAALAPWAERQGVEIHPVSLVGRRRYQTMWWNQLREHISGKLWPPQSRYSKE